MPRNRPATVVPEKLWTRAETARAIGIGLRTLEQLIADGLGPPVVVLGLRCHRYRPAAVQQWLLEKEAAAGREMSE